jgi:RNA methyltransferase, TrmH family
VPAVLTSRDNPRVKRWAKLAEDSRLRRKENRALIEGPHLLAALLDQGMKPVAVIVTEEGLEKPEVKKLAGDSPVLLSKNVFKFIVDAENPPGIAAEIAIPKRKQSGDAQVFLEGVQDPGNVGAIIRSAAAFGVGRIVLDPGCADAWSPRALRAGMGGHFSLRIDETHALEDELKAFEGTLVCTVPRGGVSLKKLNPEKALGWIFGAEGQGVSPKAALHAKLRITIPMSGGAESLNVAAAAAICLYEAFSRPASGS